MIMFSIIFCCSELMTCYLYKTTFKSDLSSTDIWNKLFVLSGILVNSAKVLLKFFLLNSLSPYKFENSLCLFSLYIHHDVTIWILVNHMSNLTKYSYFLHLTLIKHFLSVVKTSLLYEPSSSSTINEGVKRYLH